MTFSLLKRHIRAQAQRATAGRKKVCLSLLSLLFTLTQNTEHEPNVPQQDEEAVRVSSRDSAPLLPAAAVAAR